MFDDDDFNLFDDKQTEDLNSPSKPEGDETDELLEEADDSTDTSSTDDSSSEDDKADDEGTEDNSDASDGEESSEETSDDDKSDDKTDEAQGASAGASSDQDDTSKDEVEERFATKDDIRAALAEQERARELSATTRRTMRDELRNELFPEGIDIDLQVRDSDNGIITGPSQIAGKLINPSTQELFTYEEAKDYWDNAQKQIDKKVEEREQLLDAYAENNQSFFEGSQIVEQKYGAFLQKNPDIAKQLLDNYLATAKVTKSGYITEMPINVVAYYDSVMSPMNSVASQMELERQGEEARKVAAAERQQQSERADLPVNNNNTPAKKKDGLTSAFDRYFGGK